LSSHFRSTPSASFPSTEPHSGSLVATPRRMRFPRLRLSCHEFPVAASEARLPVGRSAEPLAANAKRRDTVAHPVMTDQKADETLHRPSLRAISPSGGLVPAVATGRLTRSIGIGFHVSLVGIRGSGAIRSTVGRFSGHCRDCSEPRTRASVHCTCSHPLWAIATSGVCMTRAVHDTN
jgi:hypothetical protein